MSETVRMRARALQGAPTQKSLFGKAAWCYVACEIRLQEQGGTLGSGVGVAGGDGSEVSGRTCPAEWKGSESGWVWVLCSRRSWRRGQTRWRRHSREETARGKEGGGLRGQSSPRVVGGLGVKSLEPR